MASVVLLAIGSRGDVQPMAVLGGALAARGVSVKVVALQGYASLVTGLGAEFVGLPGRISDAFARTQHAWGRLALRSVSGQALLIERWLAASAADFAEVIDQAVAPGDSVITGILGRDVATALVQQRGCRMATVLFTAQLPTAERDSHFLPGWFLPWDAYNRWGTRYNWTAAAAMGRSTGRELRKRLGMASQGAGAATRFADRYPILLAASPLVVVPASDWPANVHQTGFWAMPRQPFLPDAELVDFLAEGEPPVYVGFGSMAAARPQQVHRMVSEAALRAGVRVVLPSDGSIRPGRIDGGLFVVGDTPHGWLLPRMAGIVHHGGAGTTHDGLRAGVPSVAVPFGVDQPYHALRLHQLGVGPAPIRYLRLTPNRLAGLLSQVSSARYRARATELGEQLRAEDGVGQALRVLESHDLT